MVLGRFARSALRVPIAQGDRDKIYSRAGGISGTGRSLNIRYIQKRVFCISVIFKRRNRNAKDGCPVY